MDILGEYSVLAADHLNAMIVDGTLAAHAKRMNAYMPGCGPLGIDCLDAAKLS